MATASKIMGAGKMLEFYRDSTLASLGFPFHGWLIPNSSYPVMVLEQSESTVWVDIGLPALCERSYYYTLRPLANILAASHVAGLKGIC